jgi:OmpA-OmpF porin, OOP family
MKPIVSFKKSKIMHVFVAVSAIYLGAMSTAQAAGTPHVVSAADKLDASTINFDAPSKAWRSEGTFPNLESIAKMQVGLTKQEVYTHFGKPHFSEGFFAVRRWDYIFKFNVAEKVEVCQYQIRYADSLTVSNTFWDRPECSQFAAQNVKVAAAQPQYIDRVVEKVVEKPVDRFVEKVVEKQVTINRLTLQGDALFGFGKSSINDILPGGRSQLSLLAKSIKSDIRNIETIQITGHTDRLGGDAINAELSLARANTIRDALVTQGVSASTFKTVGMGAGKPVKFCEGSQSPSLIACLQDNRRVEIEVTGLTDSGTNSRFKSGLALPETKFDTNVLTGIQTKENVKNSFAQPEEIVHNLNAPDKSDRLKWSPIRVRAEP